MGKIVQLSDKLSNLIAAGEVVENMASVVKELVENSIDAESSEIQIDLLDTGLNEIKVTDNGQGMSKEDIYMCFKRHATSKIKTSHDLYHISTLGFRGEAIPSIASVSHLEIISSEGQTGYRLLLKNGQIIEEGEAAPKKGTSINVRYLFYNTPARLKHLKATNTELSYVVDYINKIALSHPEISFTLTNNNKRLFKSPGTNELLKVLSNIYSIEIIKNMSPFEGENAYFSISGYVTKPQFTRSTRNHITVIANDRMIKNNKIVNAVSEGYKTYLPVGKYPIVFLKIDLDPLLIDVNVHPQKLEVKFTEERMLLSLITKTIREQIQTLNLIPEMKEIVKEEPYKYEKLNLTSNEETPVLVKEDFVKFIEKKVNETNNVNIDHDIKNEPVSTLKRKVPKMEYIGTYMSTYLLCQNDEGLYIIDQHAAAERIRYENYYEKFGNVSVDTMELLIPITLELSNSEVIALTDSFEQFLPLGIKLKVNGFHGVDITHVPTYFPQGFEKDYTEEIVKYVLSGKDISVAEIRDGLAKNLSCKHSIKANKYINRNEIDSLLYDLEQCSNPYTCPHGRPVIIKFTVTEIEKMFKRIM
jgi:DNA mismatch repair protein MutL